MKVINKIMYHIHTNNEYDNIWQENTKFIVDKDFPSVHGLAIAYFNTNIICSDGSISSLQYQLEHFLQQDIENLNSRLIKRLLQDSYRIIYNANQTKCEAALEFCRRKKYKHLPSRLHSIWVTDKDNLDFWLDILRGREIFEVSLTGNLFKSSDIYIPDDNMNLSDAIIAANQYWNPVFTEEAEKAKEYLFQGKVLVKRKIN